MLESIKYAIKRKIYQRYNISFSKSGDDLQLMKLINQSTPGTYVDIGCWHPVKSSNSFFFSLRNWKGICIDPNPELQKLYKKFRPNDVFVNCAVGDKEADLKYYMLSDNYSSMNTLNLDFLKKHDLEKDIKNTITIPTFSLKEILDKNISVNDRLDFFDVDVEGFDLQVLQSNDWEKYRPKVVATESDISIKEDVVSEITVFLESVNYRLVGKTVMNGNLGNLLFLDNNL
jgi:FkbM family methyltransferase